MFSNWTGQLTITLRLLRAVLFGFHAKFVTSIRVLYLPSSESPNAIRVSDYAAKLSDKDYSRLVTIAKIFTFASTMIELYLEYLSK